jgi:hypothetical protein
MKFLWYVFNPQVELTVGGLMPDIRILPALSFPGVWKLFTAR